MAVAKPSGVLATANVSGCGTTRREHDRRHHARFHPSVLRSMRVAPPHVLVQGVARGDGPEVGRQL
jgi:hypothetical protein